ncbi:MAG: methylmalonyl-CoA carboxyltransferase, partial [Actinomycetota bacterium]|nr:methylmalonyl-CoA carboxyltransferase [Actinomycetota bacterium]
MRVLAEIEGPRSTAGSAPGLAQLRLEGLFDRDSMQVLRSTVRSQRLDRTVPGDGVVVAEGTVSGRPVVSYAQDPSFLGGSLGEAQAASIERCLQLAASASCPVVAFVESAGARIQEGVATLAGYARVFHRIVALSGVVPQISVVTGTSAGGACYSPALTDFVIATESARMFLTGPGVVRQTLGEEVTAEELGAPRVHERSGVCHLVAADDQEAIALAKELLSYLPQCSGQEPPLTSPAEPGLDDPGEAVPREARHTYDVREVIRGIADSGAMLEISRRWARGMVTAFARIDGRPVGVIANQPAYRGGLMDIDTSQKGARFVSTCDAFGLPLIVLVDTPGFMPGTKQETGGVIRHGASLLREFARARVPKISVVLRKAYGGAYITMSCKDLGADFAYAWPGAEIGIMGARQAIAVTQRRLLKNGVVS